MKSRFIKDEIKYTGEQLRSHFAFETFGIAGDSIVAFVGPCDVKPEYMVDVDDLKAGNAIYSERMLHLIVEHHDMDLERNILRQLLLANIIKEKLNEILGRDVVDRSHTDLYDSDAKLSVSIATLSPISGLIHFGVNISSKNTPVKTLGLDDYGIDASKLAETVMKAYIEELDHADHARYKVKWVP